MPNQWPPASAQLSIAPRSPCIARQPRACGDGCCRWTPPATARWNCSLTSPIRCQPGRGYRSGPLAVRSAPHCGIPFPATRAGSRWWPAPPSMADRRLSLAVRTARHGGGTSPPGTRYEPRWGGHRGPVTAVACTPPDSEPPLAVTGGADGSVRVWKLATCRRVTEFTGHRGKVWAVAFTTHKGVRSQQGRTACSGFGTSQHERSGALARQPGTPAASGHWPAAHSLVGPSLLLLEAPTTM
jgi:hypothetical protein